MGIEVTMDRDPGGYGPDMEGWMDSTVMDDKPIAINDVIDEACVACASGLWRADGEVFTVPSWSVSRGRASGRLLRCIPCTFSERQTRLHNKGGYLVGLDFRKSFCGLSLRQERLKTNFQS